MKLRRLLPVLALLVPTGLLVSTGCGIFTLPVEGPKIAVVNSKLIGITSDVVDDAGQPLDGVTAQINLHSLDTNIFIPEVEKTDGEKLTFDKTFSYSSFGHYAVVVTFTKPGYATVQRVYSFEDHVNINSNSGMFSMDKTPVTFPPEAYINTIKTPRSTVVMPRQ